MRVNSEEESTNLLVIAEISKRPHTSKLTGRHNVFTHFPNDPNCEVCKLAKTTPAPCRNRPEARGARIPQPQKRWSCSGGSKSSQWIWSVCESSCCQVRNQVLFIQIIPWHICSCLWKLVLKWRQVNTMQIRNRRTCRNCSPWSIRRDFCSSGSVGSSRKLVGRSPWNASVFFFCATHKTNWQTETHRMKEELALHLMVSNCTIWGRNVFFCNLIERQKSSLINLVQRWFQENS